MKASNNTSNHNCRFKAIFTALIIFVLLGLNSGKSKAASNDSLSPILGTYNVEFSGRIGGPHEPSGSIGSGTTTGIQAVTMRGSITLSASQPGVIAVPPGTQIPGIARSDIIYGSAVIQNPLRIFIGTPGASKAGDFGLHSMMKFGIPGDPSQLFYSGCSAYGGPFRCIPMFFRRSAPSGRSVNLIYHIIRINDNENTIMIHGELLDTHKSEASVVNIFQVPIFSPILGAMNEPFMFNPHTRFEIRISGRNITGTIQGTGHSIAGMVPQTAIFELAFRGQKK